MVLILSDEENADLLRLSLKQQGIQGMRIHDLELGTTGLIKCGPDGMGNWKEMFGQIGAIVSFGAEYAKDLTDNHLPLLSEHTDIYAARPNAFLATFWEAAVTKGQSICRVDSRAALAAELSLVIETKKVISTMGSTALLGVPVVAGGVIGKRGSVIVDSVEKPTRVIGIADGLGGLLRLDEEAPYQEAKEKVRKKLIKDLYKKRY